MRERELFVQALDIADPAARARFLDRACRGDRALRESIDQLLAWHARGPGWLEEPLPERMLGGAVSAGGDGPARSRTTPPSPATGIAPGDPPLAGTIRIGRPLPATPSGPAWGGVDDRGAVPVTVQALAAERARDPHARGRFLATARRLATIRHDGLPPVVAMGERPVPWVAFAAVDGEPFARRVMPGSLPGPAALLPIGIGVAGALAALHDAGHVHRTLAPGGILLGAGDPSGVWLVEAGLADAASGDGGPAGLPGVDVAFLAPEQLGGTALDRLDHRPDLFALGSVLVYLATGLSPFDSATPEGIVRRVADAAPRPELLAALAPPLRAVVADLLRADPRDRPRSAHDVAAALAAMA